MKKKATRVRVVLTTSRIGYAARKRTKLRRYLRTSTDRPPPVRAAKCARTHVAIEPDPPVRPLFFFKQKTAYEIGLGIPAEPLFRSVTEQSVRFQTALASIKLIQASAVLDLTE